jgi:hypothetical protein
MAYKCDWGCTSYNASCDACEGTVFDDTTGWVEPKETTNNRFKAATRGQTLNEYLEDDDDDDS